MKKSNKILAVVLALVMMLTAVPMMTAGAADEEQHEHVFAVKVVDEEKVIVEPTCITKGYTVYECTDEECTETFSVYTDALGHDLIGSYTITDDAHIKHCDRCKIEVPAVHDWVSTVKTPATCTTVGKAEEKCKDCGTTREVDIPVVGHTFSSVVADSVVEGVQLTHSGVCTVCNATKVEAHNWNDGVVTTKPQCAATGVKTYTCTVCNATKTETIPAAHTLPEKAVKVDDDTHKYVCTVAGCGYKFNAVELALEEKTVAHKFVVVVGETSKCDDSVALTVTCKDCNYKLETKATQHDFDKIEKYDENSHKQTCKNEGCNLTVTAPHNWEDVKELEAATCGKVGSKEVKCKDCKETAIVEVPKLAEHTWGDWEVTKQPGFLTKGEETRTCDVCGEKETRKIDEVEEKVGDVNGDSKVSAVDARLILQHVAKTRELSAAELKRADIVGNGDGVKATDARKVLQIVAGLDK